MKNEDGKPTASTTAIWKTAKEGKFIAVSTRYNQRDDVLSH